MKISQYRLFFNTRKEKLFAVLYMGLLNTVSGPTKALQGRSTYSGKRYNSRSKGGRIKVVTLQFM